MTAAGHRAIPVHRTRYMINVPATPLELIPSHCDTTINLHDVYYVTRGGYVVAVWPIAARGRAR